MDFKKEVVLILKGLQAEMELEGIIPTIQEAIIRLENSEKNNE